jgi:hypothetical protein
MAGDGFRASPELIAKAFGDHPLTAQVLKNLSRKYSRAVGSGIAEGKSNAGWVAEYSYKARVQSSKQGAILDFVFEASTSRRPHQMFER